MTHGGVDHGSGHPIHRSLHRTITYAGAAPEFVIVEVAAIAALLFVAGLHIATIALALVYATVVHTLAVRVTARDPQMIHIYLRSLGEQDFYPPHSVPLAPVDRPAVAFTTKG